MKKNEMSNLRGLRAGGYSIVLSLIVIAAVVVLNLLVANNIGFIILKMLHIWQIL